MLHIGVLASTKATDMQAVIDAIISKKLNAVISVVISNKQDAYALKRAKNNNIKAVFLDSKGKQREEYDKEISLIGYMRFLSPWFVNKYKNRIMNIHPSLLPKYAGGMDTNVHEEVLKNNEKVTGATLHFVDEGADTGPIIMQKEVRIEKNETVDSLKEKVQKAEQDIIIKAIDLYSRGKIKVIKNKAVIK